MNIDQIIRTIPEQETRDHIRRQYQSDLEVLGEREALEFARFRADAASTCWQQKPPAQWPLNANKSSA